MMCNIFQCFHFYFMTSLSVASICMCIACIFLLACKDLGETVLVVVVRTGSFPLPNICGAGKRVQILRMQETKDLSWFMHS